MIRFCQSRASVGALFLALAFISGCSRPTPNLATEGVTQSDPTPPHTLGTGNTAGPSVSPQNAAPGTGPPFQDSEVPAGTLLTVSLNVPLIAKSGFNPSFEAVLDEPVVVDGNTLIPRDSVVSGRIESSQRSEDRPDWGYMRLTLDSVQVDGTSVPIQTASLFARQTAPIETDSGTVRVEKGRRLTFRLRETVFFHPTAPKAGQ